MRYRLTEKIGTGGMAEVFRAVGEGPEGFERPFVVKRIHPHLCDAPEFVRMFVDEAKISARLIHPNIIQVFEFAQQEGRYYIVMEPVEGIDMGWLRRQIERRREPLPTTFVAEVGRQACRGLDFAHTLTDVDGKPLGIVHRDVTPPNIMAAWNGTVKMLDFGIARAAQALRTNQTDPGMVKGKMSYVAPELLEGKTADARSDVFSLGVVLHELLTGRQLFAGETDLETLKQVTQMPIPPPSALNAGVKPALDRVILRALERDPDKRYRSAGDMGNDLEDLVLRKSYSPRALGRTTRELFSRQDAVSGRHLALEAPISIGREDSSVVVEDRTTQPRKAGRSPSSWPVGAPSDRKRWIWFALGPAAVLAVALVWAASRRPAAATGPGSAPSTVVERSPTVRVVLDSVPQSATITAAAISGGARLGETPMLLTLPRGPAAVDFVLSKPGFVPLLFKIVPQQDKDVLATLELARATPAPATPRPLAKVRTAKPGAPTRKTPVPTRVAARIAPAPTPPRAPAPSASAAAPARPAPPPKPRPPTLPRR
jgi:eukaryotic-like serine/threonine-protein kinase